MDRSDDRTFPGPTRIYTTTPERIGILELATDGYPDTGVLPTWSGSVHLFGTVTVANNSDFAAISSADGQQIVVFFQRLLVPLMMLGMHMGIAFELLTLLDHRTHSNNTSDLLGWCHATIGMFATRHSATDMRPDAFQRAGWSQTCRAVSKCAHRFSITL